MLELDWCELLTAWHEKRRGAVFWTTAPMQTLEHGLHAHSLAFVPHYTAPGQCSSVDVPFSDGKHVDSVRIKRVPENHRELQLSFSACKTSCT